MNSFIDLREALSSLLLDEVLKYYCRTYPVPTDEPKVEFSFTTEMDSLFPGYGLTGFWGVLWDDYE